MLRNVTKLADFAIQATDGNIGKVKRFFFDDEDWAIRYLIVETGNWIVRRNEVLISPIFIRELDWDNSEIHVNLTRDQVKHSPPMDSQQPISRKQEQEFFSYYRTPAYWSGYGLWGTGMHPEDMLSLAREPKAATWETSPEATPSEEKAEVRLHSSRELLKHKVFAYRGEVGKIVDIIFDDRSWAIRYLVVEPKKLLAGRKVLLSPWWTREISWKQKLVFVDMENATIEDAPTYDPNQPVTPEYEEQLVKHYGRSAVWKR
jgi:sporulation protein YlmC with PRC-barrel domain